MYGRCQKCPGKDNLRTYLDTIVENDKDHMIVKQWVTTDRADLITQMMSPDEFIDKCVQTIDELTTHSYVARSQSSYFSKAKEDLSPEEAIVVGDFSENYCFVVQDAVQSHHWNKQCCTVHPLVMYKKEEGEVRPYSFCVLSDDLNHDASFVYETQASLTQIIRENHPDLKHIKYFSDGCAGQYKNYKNFMNLCHHLRDFGLSAEWVFHATSHGKTACDGVGGTVKRLTARASLQRPVNDQILTVHDMMKFCTENIKNIHFIFISKEEMSQVRKMQQHRYDSGRRIPGTRRFHHYKPSGLNSIQYKEISTDEHYLGTFHFSTGITENLEVPFIPRLNEFVACIYDNRWWIGVVEKINEAEEDCRIKCLHPSGPARSFVWPAREDRVWVVYSHVLCSIDVPTTRSSSGRTYTIADQTRIQSIFAKKIKSL